MAGCSLAPRVSGFGGHRRRAIAGGQQQSLVLPDWKGKSWMGPCEGGCVGGVHAQGCMAGNPRAGGSAFCCGFHPFIAPGPAHGAACKEP